MSGGISEKDETPVAEPPPTQHAPGGDQHSAQFAWSDGTGESQFSSLLGKRVRLHGLLTRADLNGQTGEVMSLDAATGRAGVCLDDDDTATSTGGGGPLPKVQRRVSSR